ncbi:MAG TPA: hypothetical protein VKB70_07085 [Gaiellaceae bacterium]|nr:hypothetical protein [Gaiellaceae bacterium]
MVDALTRIHAALVPGGVLVDTQPVSLRLPVTVAGEAIGELEDEEWLETVAAVGSELMKAIAAGLFEVRHEERYSVVHEFGSGDECLEVVGTWAGTHIPDGILARLEGSRACVTVEHDVRLRLLDRC